ncbi:MAG: GAF domain-containing SpoIIE family protein phosphatase [bacterium]
MNRLKKIVTLVALLLLFLSVFIYDVATSAVDLGVTAAGLIRVSVILAAFVLLLYFQWLQMRQSAIVLPKTMGRLLVYCVLLLILMIVILGEAMLEGGSSGLFPSSSGEGSLGALAIFRISIVSILFGIFSFLTLLIIYNQVIYKRKKGTRRNFLFFCFIIAAYAIVSVPNVSEKFQSGTMQRKLSSAQTEELQKNTEEGTARQSQTIIQKQGEDYTSSLKTYLLVAAIILMVINSFKQNWIVYLSRREKVFSLIYEVLLFCFYLSYCIFSTNSVGEVILSGYVAWLQPFVFLTMIFGAIYFGMAFITTLFHLPTAEVYERKKTELTSLHNLSRLITQVFDFSDLVNTVTNMTLEVVGAKSTWLELIKGQSEDGRIAVEVVSRKNITQEEIELITAGEQHSIRRLVIDSKRPLLIDDVMADKRTQQLKKTKIDIGSILSVPLISHGEFIGFLHATKDYRFGFDQEDSDVLTTFVDQVTIAIENANLIAKSLERERYQRDIMVAREMQKKLLPQRVPYHPAFEISAISIPSEEVGGDYYDFITLSPERLGIIVGDVAGKGVSAAFYMAEVKGIFQSLGKLCPSPKDLLSRTNDTLRENLEKKAFISVLYGVLTIDTQTLTIARAGHCPMIFLSGSETKLIRPNGIGLGLTDKEIFDRATEEVRIKLKTGDICIFYSDGINEARNADGEEFGYDRLIQATVHARHRNADGIKENILEEVRNYATNSTYGDDVTLVVIKWLGQETANAQTPR